MSLQEAPCFEELVRRYPDADNLQPDPELVAAFLRDKLRPTRRQLLAHVATSDNHERLVPLAPVRLAGKHGALLAAQHNMSMYAFTGGKVYVREVVADKLHTAASYLGDNAPITDRRQLCVTYGYRPKSVQTESNLRVIGEILRDGFEGSDEELLDRMHILSAQVEVSGHPTGGSVDATMVDWHGDQVDVGVDPADNRTELFYWPFITKEQGRARHELRGALVAAGFDFYEGENGHVDYGTPEWAFHEQQRQDEARTAAGESAGPLVVARYSQVEFTARNEVMAIR